MLTFLTFVVVVGIVTIVRSLEQINHTLREIRAELDGTAAVQRAQEDLYQ